MKIILCDTCANNVPAGSGILGDAFCTRGRPTFPKAILQCADYRPKTFPILPVPIVPAEVKPPKQTEFFTYQGEKETKCVAYAYLPEGD